MLLIVVIHLRHPLLHSSSLLSAHHQSSIPFFASSLPMTLPMSGVLPLLPFKPSCRRFHSSFLRLLHHHLLQNRKEIIPQSSPLRPLTISQSRSHASAVSTPFSPPSQFPTTFTKSTIITLPLQPPPSSKKKLFHYFNCSSLSSSPL